jgi:hypothetical protein
MFGEESLNRRTGSGSDLAGSQDIQSLGITTSKVSEANRPGRYRFLFCG